MGGSTNAIVPLIAIAGRRGISLPLSLFDELSRTTPVIVNLKPSGQYLMEDLFYAGGVPALLREMLPSLHGEAYTVEGKTLAEAVEEATSSNGDVIRPLSQPLHAEGALAVLHGNLACQGDVSTAGGRSRI